MPEQSFLRKHLLDQPHRVQQKAYWGASAILSVLVGLGFFMWEKPPPTVRADTLFSCKATVVQGVAAKARPGSLLKLMVRIDEGEPRACLPSGGNWRLRQIRLTPDFAGNSLLSKHAAVLLHLGMDVHDRSRVVGVSSREGHVIVTPADIVRAVDLDNRLQVPKMLWFGLAAVLTLIAGFYHGWRARREEAAALAEQPAQAD